MIRPQCRRVERQARRMHDMMEKLEVDPGKLVRAEQGEAYARARRMCLDCTETDRCLDWLEDATSTPHPDFCPNLDLFEMCRTSGSDS